MQNYPLMFQLEVSSPSLFIVGRVMQLADKLQWYETSQVPVSAEGAS